MENPQRDIYSYIQEQEKNFKLPIDIMGWSWNMEQHIKTSFYYKHGRLLTGNSDDKPVKNITKPILNLQYRTEDIDVKDVQLYINDQDKYHLSFLVKKYYEDVFVKEHNLDEYFDKLNISRIDYGGGLSKKINSPCPEVVPLESIAFCDQTDILSGPIAIKHYYSPDQLKEMERFGWGKFENGATVTIDELIILSRDEKKDRRDGQTNKTPGKYIEIYEIHGTLPEIYLKDDGEDTNYVRQFQIVAFYQSEKGEKQGVCLFRKEEKEPAFKLILRDPIHGRALGFGGAEELFENQVWVNYDVIRMKDMLDAASKIIIQTDDDSLAAKHPSGLKNLDNLEIVTIGENKKISQVDTFPRNIQLFERSIEEWEAHAQQIGAANDSIMGVNPNSGTPFKLQELVTQESHGLHDYRRGIFAKHIEEVHRDWILPYICKEITKGAKFLSSLDLEEMQQIQENVAINESNKIIKERILNGINVTPEEQQMIIEEVKVNFMKDNKKFIEILKDELKNVPLEISINIAGKQKYLAAQVDKLVNVFRQIASAPQILDDPRMAKIFNQILEGSGLNPIDFTTFKQPQQMQPGQPQQANPTLQPMQQLNNNQ